MSHVAAHCPVDRRVMEPELVAQKLPPSPAMSAPELWNLILAANNKGQMIGALRRLANSHGMLGNNCPQEVRDKLDKMEL